MKKKKLTIQKAWQTIKHAEVVLQGTTCSMEEKYPEEIALIQNLLSDIMDIYWTVDFYEPSNPNKDD